MTEKDPDRGDVVKVAYVYANNYDEINWNAVYDAVEKDLNMKESKKRFFPPVHAEVCAYMETKDVLSYEVEAEKFIDFYASKGWFVGKTKMKDWRAAVRNWIRGLKTNQFNSGNLGRLSKPIHNHSESDSVWSK